MGFPLPGAPARSQPRHAAPRRSLRRRLVPVPALLAVAVAAVGSSGALPVDPRSAADPATSVVEVADGAAAVVAGSAPPVRESEVSRSSSRGSTSDARQRRTTTRDRDGRAPGADSGRRGDRALQAEVERQARARNRALADLAAAARARAEEIEADRWVMPLGGYTLTSSYGPRWGRMHEGLDLAAPTGTPLVAVARGTVTSAAYDGGYGNKVVLTLEDGTDVWYCHMTSFAVTSGQAVEAGDAVGTVGSTGNVTGPHLHLEFHPGGGGPVDPAPLMAANGLTP